MTGLHHRLRGSALASSIQFVGGVVGTGGNSGSVSLTALTGGVDTTAQAGDIVIGFLCVYDASDAALVIGTGYTLIGSELYVSTGGVNLRAAYKVMGGSPDTSLAFSSDIGVESAWGALVFRGFDAGTPIDVTTTTATGANSDVTNANPPAITPVTPGSVIVAIGGGCSSAALTAFTSSDLSNFVHAERTSGSFKAQIGAGSAIWSGSGAFNPAQFGGGVSDNSADWAAITLALRST